MAEFRYTLTQAPAGRNDGSGHVDHQIIAEVKDNGEFVPMAGRNKSFCVPVGNLTMVMEMADNAAKIAAYKDLLIDSIGTQPTPNTGWSKVELEATHAANVTAEAAAEAANAYITETLNQSYPVSFVI